ncbi:MAG: T9SS type A sorting domain-containing protein [Flavobacteriales bacterium]
MNLKKYLIIGLLSILSVAYSQEFAPVGATWIMGYQEPGATPNQDPVHTFNSIEVTGYDTINNQPCKVLENVFEPRTFNSGHDYIYNDSGKVFAYFEHQDAFQKIFDFDASVGHSWDILMNHEPNINSLLDTFRISIDSTFYENLSGENVRSYLFSGQLIWHADANCATDPVSWNYDFENRKANEKLGVDFWLLPLLNGSFCVADPYPLVIYPNTRCYSDATLSWSDLGDLPSCDYQNVGLNEVNGLSLNYWISDQTLCLQLVDNQTIDIDLTICDISGNVLIEHQTTLETDLKLDVSALKPGPYIVRVSNLENGFWSTKVIVKQ